MIVVPPDFYSQCQLPSYLLCFLLSKMINKKQISHIGISATNLSHFRVRKSLSILLSFNAGITAAATRISFTWRLTNPFHRELHTVFHHRQLSVISFRMYSLCSSTFCFNFYGLKISTLLSICQFYFQNLCYWKILYPVTIFSNYIWFEQKSVSGRLSMIGAAVSLLTVFSIL